MSASVARWSSLRCSVAHAVAGRSTAQTPRRRTTTASPRRGSAGPGGQDACAVDLTTTVIAEDGRLTQEKFTPNPKAPIDCFYVYPTVSLDPGGNSDMTPGNEERNVIRAQFARFASQCRPFAPLYRQFTLTALRADTAGKPIAVGSRAWLQRRARRVEPLPEERQQRPRRRADRPLAGIRRARRS